MPAWDEETDAGLVRRARGRDEHAYAELYRRYVRAVTRIVADRLPNMDDRADAVQDTFARAFQRLDQLDDPERFSSWLYAIARNEALQAVRRNVRAAEPLPEEHLDRPSRDPGPVELSELSDLAGRVRGAGVVLSARDATALTLAVDFGMGPAEIAVALGVSEGNAKVILHRARQRLRAALGVLPD